MCRICDNNEGWFHTFEVDSVGFSTCNFLRQLFGKPIWNEPIFSCKSCYFDTLGVRTSLDNLAKRIDGPSPLTRSESDFFANCVFQREGAPDPIARLSFEEESVASPHSPPHSPKQGQYYARLGFMEVNMRAEKQSPKCPEIGSEEALREPRGGPKTAL